MSVDADSIHETDELKAAWFSSGYARVSADARRQLLDTAEHFHLAAGDHLRSVSSVAKVGLVVTGSLRVYVASGARQVTFQYAGPGSAFGVPNLRTVDGKAGPTTDAQAVLDSRMVIFRTSVVESLADVDATMSRAVISGLLDAHHASVSLLAEHVLSPLRQRVARHLLDLAVREGAAVVMRSSVQDLAHATGTVREVVTRLLRELREEGLVQRKAGVLVLHDMHRLHQIAQGLDEL
ncbi:Crp/Fnr family transcriptional regulator [Pseudonocardia lutea]|uniref:Crp/Fnr family transcriptional regulator n=1 Tax=Pseudonocardia lutea TaxID=2172015 RepID=A0ABW1I9S8_9PSEU